MLSAWLVVGAEIVFFGGMGGWGDGGMDGWVDDERRIGEQMSGTGPIQRGIG